MSWNYTRGQGLFIAILVTVIGVISIACNESPPTQPSPPPSPGPGPQPPVQRSTGPLAFVSTRAGSPQIYLANEDGSSVTLLTDGDAPAWSPDGQRIVFVRGLSELWAINVDGSGRRTIGEGRSPDWSPNGSTLVVEHDAAIDVVDADGSNRRRLFSHPYFAFEPAWSPDGLRIALSVGTFIDFDTGLWIVNADGSGARWIENLWDVTAPAWSPDGSEIAFVSNTGLGVAAPDGSRRRGVVSGPIFNAGWTPDGRLIYSRSITGNRSGPGRVFVSEGGVERQLIPDASAPARTDYSDWSIVWRR